MLLQSPFPPDIRLEKEIKSLKSSGFMVTLLCNQFEKNKEPDFEYCEITRIKAISKNPKFNKLINFPFILNLRVLFYTVKAYLKTKPAVIHVHDLPMMPFGIVLKGLFNAKLIFDMHENYPEALKAYDKGIIEKIIKNYNVAKFFEKVALKFSDLILVVTPENQERLLEEKIPNHKVKVVSNTVDLTFFDSAKQPKNMELRTDTISLIYSGRVSKNRGLDTAIKSINYIKEELESVSLKIVGEGSYLNALKKLAVDLGVTESVDFISWPGHDKIATYIKNSTICIIPQPSNGHSDTTVPHKLFEFMLFDRPILTSDAKPLKRIVEETGCGETFASDNPQSFAEGVIKIIKSDKKYGENGLSAVKTKYNWNIDSRVLIDSYNQLLSLNSS